MIGLNRPDLFREQAFVGGQWIDGTSGERRAVTDPATGRVIGSVPELAQQETEWAIAAATRAWPDWRERTAAQRGEILRRWFEVMLEHREDLARILTLEQGKSIAEARSEIGYAAGFLEWFAEEGKRVYGETIPSPWPDRRIVVTRQPIGLCAAITPWNFPAAMITRKVGPALAAGCPVLVKPAEQTPFSALAMAVLAEQAGVPPGILSILTGPGEVVGLALSTDARVRKVSFTGSTQVGRILMQQGAATLKKLSLELGGNAPFIVFADADLDAAVEGAMTAKFRNNGQTCVCANRFYVHESVYHPFARKLAAAASRLRIGPGIAADTDLGPLIDAAALRKVRAHVEDARARGGEVILGGSDHPLGGTFYGPTIITNAHPAMTVAQEETFGPVAALFRFTDEEEVIARANDTESGLAAYFYSQDFARVCRVVERLEYGMVGVNTGVISTEVAPFGGIKQSGFGREGSRHGIDEYLVHKYACLGVS